MDIELNKRLNTLLALCVICFKLVMSILFLLAFLQFFIQK